MKILIVDDETLVRKTLQAQIESEGGHQVFSAASVGAALEILEGTIIDAVLTDLTLDNSPERAGLKLLAIIREQFPSTVAIAMTGHDEESLVELCLKAGAADYILKPIDADKLRQALRKAPVLHRLLRKTQNLRSQAGKDALKPIQIVSKSPAFNAVLATARKLRGAGQSVLICGESGTGKEVMARYLWSLENDDSRPFVAVNCGAIPASLAESELFGHKKGAFSGATDYRAGKFESAHGGDLFLDELATLSLEIQVKLLRVLATGEVYAVGQDKPKTVQCRLITATNENLEEMIQAKTFREDLFFRVKQFSLRLPPLRERKEDILDLAHEFLRGSGFADKKLSQGAQNLLLTYSWPGNVRELRSAVEVAAVLSDSGEIQASDLTPHLQSRSAAPSSRPLPVTAGLDEGSVQGSFNHLLHELESKMIDIAMKKCGSESAAAKFLGIPRSTLGDIRKRLKAGP